ncbi:MAG: hypothetical protein [Olavius algarvensis Gamma 1 endosymbiont]|nr:MAG: hypothetical protein [Olavius algarvensis Gamma 1 endosymbiont]
MKFINIRELSTGTSLISRFKTSGKNGICPESDTLKYIQVPIKRGGLKQRYS